MSGLRIQSKRQFHPARWIALLIIVAVVGAYAYYGIRWYKTGEISPLPMPVAAADSSVDESRVTTEQKNEYTVAAKEPRYLEIDDFLIKARVMKVGVDERNMLRTPSNIDDTAWYEKSATPGSGTGAVLIDGHNGGVSRDGVFSHLDKLQEGDHIKIERGDGKKFIYEVRDVRDEPLDWVNKIGMKQMMQSYDPDKEGLNLITCSGKWIPQQKLFDRRILVRATIIAY